MLRFPEGMRDRIRAEAEQNNRSMNAEIIARLEHSFDSRRAFEPDKTLSERLAMVDELMELARGLMLQEVEFAKTDGREPDLDHARKLSKEAVKRASKETDDK